MRWLEQEQAPSETAAAVITAAIFTKARRKRNSKTSKKKKKITVSYNTIIKAGVLLMTIPNIYFFLLAVNRRELWSDTFSRTLL